MILTFVTPDNPKSHFVFRRGYPGGIPGINIFSLALMEEGLYARKGGHQQIRRNEGNSSMPFEECEISVYN